MSISIVPLSQRDSRWRSYKLGFSNYTIGSHGCTLTCLTMLLRYLGYSSFPHTVNTSLKSLGNYNAKTNPKGAFLGALLVWHNISRVFKIRFVKRAYSYNNVEVSWYIYVKKLPVLVEVNAAKIGAARHWVLFIGNGKMIDPWDAKVKPTNTYPLVGYALFDRA